MTLFLTYSDGSEVNDSTAAQYGLASGDEDELWTWDEGLNVSSRDEALPIVEKRGYVATNIDGGWYGDSRDDSYILTAAAEAVSGRIMVADLDSENDPHSLHGKSASQAVIAESLKTAEGYIDVDNNGDYVPQKQVTESDVKVWIDVKVKMPDGTYGTAEDARLALKYTSAD